MLDSHTLINALVEIKPDEVYNLVAQSFVPESWQPETDIETLIAMMIENDIQLLQTK